MVKLPVIFILCAFSKTIQAQAYFESSGVECYQNIIEVKCTEDKSQATVAPKPQFIEIGSKRYIVSKENRVNWFVAADICRMFNSQLINIENEADMNAISNYLITNNLRRFYWISGNDLSKEGNFVWGNTGKGMTYARWRGGEPNNYNNQEHCLNLAELNNKYDMNDANCHSHLEFICVENTQHYDINLKLRAPSEPFVKIGAKYYLINYVGKVNWFEAGDFCRSYNAQLANIESEAELNTLTKYLAENGFEENEFWLSGNDLRKEGQWLWGDTGKPMAYVKWRDGEPNNFGNAEHCILLKKYGQFSMNDAYCTSTYNAICVW